MTVEVEVDRRRSIRSIRYHDASASVKEFATHLDFQPFAFQSDSRQSSPLFLSAVLPPYLICVRDLL